MARFEITGPDGSRYEVNAPDGATEQDAIRYIQTKLARTEAPNVSMAESFGRGALQGVTFGTSDEIYAGARGAYNKLKGGEFGTEYDTALKEVRSANDRARQANPVAFMGGEVVGGVALPMGAAGAGLRLGKTAVDATLAARTANSIKAGAAGGLAYGFGTAEGGEGSLPQQAANRVVSAVPQAIVGGAVGAVAPAAVDLGTAAVKGATNAVRASMQPKATATQKVAEALARDRPDGTAIDDAVSYAGERLQRAQIVNPASVLADVGGQNTRDLLRSASNLPSKSADKMRRTLDQRQNVQWRRIEKDLTDSLPDGNLYNERLDKWTKTLKDIGSEEFTPAYAQPWNVRADSELGKFLELPYVKRLREKAVENIEGMTGKTVADQPGSVAGAGEISPWEFLHRVKMQIDREITGLKTGKPDSKANWDLRDLSALKRNMVKLMGDENPQFRTAMEKYGDAAGIKSALEQGYEEFGKATAQEIKTTLAGMTRPEQTMYRAGAARSMFDDLERSNVNRDRTDALFASPKVQEKLAAIMPDRQRLREFQRALVIHAKQADTRKAVQGNSTTARQLAQGGEAGQPVEAMTAVANLGSGKFGQVLNYLSRQVQRFHGMTPEVADETIKILMSKGTFGTEKELQRAIARAAREPAARDQLVNRILSGVNAGMSGASAQGQQQRP